MDDEELARQLQEMEFQQAMGPNPGEQQEEGKARMLHSLEGAMQHVQEAEDEMLQALAVSLMPLDELQQTAMRTWRLNHGAEHTHSGSLHQQQHGAQRAAGQQQQAGQLAVEDYLITELLTWFKTSFFTWVNSPMCDVCCVPTSSKGVVAPSQEESRHAASRTELFSCPQCGKGHRFPRYNSVAKLLETRCGRCGEWANAFLLCCRAAGFTARYLWDINDHVWTEYWSEALGRWVHVDCCEAAFDKPLLYEAGWGKVMSYVVALGTMGVADVTCRYTAHWEQLRRTDVPEAWLSAQLASMTAALRAGLPPHLLQKCAVLDASEQQELALRRVGRISPADLQGLSSRTTGSEAWRAQRGEDGASAQAQLPAAAQAPAPTTPQCTPWTALPLTLWPSKDGSDELLRLVGRLPGGGVRAAGENGRGEGSARLFDGDVETKWLDFGGGGASGCSWVEYKLEPGQPPVTLVAYDMVSANDFPERDPCHWVLEGLVPAPHAQQQPAPAPTSSGDVPAAQPAGVSSGDQWVRLDQRRGVSFSRRHQLRCFWINHLTLTPPGASQADAGRMVPACTAWRLRISRTCSPARADCVQLACLNLYRLSPAWPPQSPSQGGASILQHIAEEVLPAQAPPAATTATATSAALPSTPVTEGLPSAHPLQLKLLIRLLSNMVSNPNDIKLRRVRACKSRALWSHPPTLQLLLAVGFRPIIMTAPVQAPTSATPTTPGAAEPPAAAAAGASVVGVGALKEVQVRDLFLVLEDSPEALARVSAAAALLQANLN